MSDNFLNKNDKSERDYSQTKNFLDDNNSTEKLSPTKLIQTKRVIPENLSQNVGYNKEKLKTKAWYHFGSGLKYNFKAFKTTRGSPNSGCMWSQIVSII